jgi:hypothetical protein
MSSRLSIWLSEKLRQSGSWGQVFDVARFKKKSQVLYVKFCYILPTGHIYIFENFSGGLMLSLAGNLNMISAWQIHSLTVIIVKVKIFIFS